MLLGPDCDFPDVDGGELGSAQDLPTDSALVTGQLDNGLRYIVRQHAYPPGRATIWMHIHSGSLNETDPQRGLAHYLEHMAFNGSENFPPGSVVPFFQSLGMTFGRDQNAFTSFDQTTYQLSLPNVEPDTISKGMTYFADVLSRLLLLPKEIEDERQIIQEERRRSLSGQQRTMYYVLERLAPGSIFGQRITIGTEETINSVQQADFQDYYGKWYVPANATLMVVADTDPQQIVSLIEKNFGAAPQVTRPTPQDVGITGLPAKLCHRGQRSGSADRADPHHTVGAGARTLDDDSSAARRSRGRAGRAGVQSAPGRQDRGREHELSERRCIARERIGSDLHGGVERAGQTGQVAAGAGGTRPRAAARSGCTVSRRGRSRTPRKKSSAMRPGP